METIEQYIDQISDLLQKLDGLPAIAVVALACLVVGYVLRFIKRFPNDAIPLIVTLWGGWYAIIADANNDLPMRVWIIRNVLVGFIVGFGTWVFHRVVLKRLEDKIPFLRDWLAPLEPPTNPNPEPPKS